MLRVATLVGSVIAALSVAGGHAAVAEAADPHDGNLSLGTTAPAQESAYRVSPPQAGRPHPGKPLDSLADIKAVGQRVAGVAELSGGTRLDAPRASPEVILGSDDRRRVWNTRSFPASATVLILFSIDPSDFRDQPTAGCTGWMISADTVVTAAHCVHQGRRGTWYRVPSFQVFPGQNGMASPFGGCTARWLAAADGWTRDRGVAFPYDRYDYGAIKLNCRIGETTGWYGFFATTVNIDNAPTIVAGYPGDKPLTQWRSRGGVVTTLPRQIAYNNDTFPGMSGAPIYERYSNCSYCAYAIHDAGVEGLYNIGVKITPAVYDTLIAWRNLR